MKKSYFSIRIYSYLFNSSSSMYLENVIFQIHRFQSRVNSILLPKNYSVLATYFLPDYNTLIKGVLYDIKVKHILHE